MKIGFVHLDTTARPNADHVSMVLRLIASIRRAMPTVPVVHLTDEHTLGFATVDEVFRRPVSKLIALAVLQLYAAASEWTDKTQPRPEWIFVDTDVLFHAPVEHVFDSFFDIAVAKRDGTLLPHEVGTKFMAQQPYNKGVVFSRSEKFWRDCVTKCAAMKPARQAWMGDQIAMNQVIAEWRYRVKELDPRYNYPPKSKNESLADKFVTHWKGKRKAWMLERAA